MGSTPTPYQKSFASASISHTPDAVADGLRVHPGLTWCRLAGVVEARKGWTWEAGKFVETPIPKSSALAVVWHAPTPTLEALGRELSKALSYPDTHAVLGLLHSSLGERGARDVRRCQHPDPERGEVVGTFQECKTWLLCLDLDGLPLDVGWPVERLGREVLARMGLDSSAGFVWQWTGSAGRKPGVRARLWALWSEPVALRDVRAWVDDVAARLQWPLDGRVCLPSQPIYTAPPWYIGGPDPYPTRLFVFDGPPVGVGAVVSVARARSYMAKLKAREARERVEQSRQRMEAAGLDGRGARRWLVEKCAQLASTAKGGRHNATCAAVGGAAALISQGALDAMEVRARLTDAVQVFNDPRHHEAIIEAYLPRWSL